MSRTETKKKGSSEEDPFDELRFACGTGVACCRCAFCCPEQSALVSVNIIGKTDVVRHTVPVILLTDQGILGNGHLVFIGLPVLCEVLIGDHFVLKLHEEVVLPDAVNGDRSVPIHQKLLVPLPGGAVPIIGDAAFPFGEKELQIRFGSRKAHLHRVKFQLRRRDFVQKQRAFPAGRIKLVQRIFAGFNVVNGIVPVKYILFRRVKRSQGNNRFLCGIERV